MKENYNVLSSRKCQVCHKPIKANLVNKKTSPHFCYKCYRTTVQNKPAHHVPRMKRVDAGLPVHNQRS